MTFKIKDYEIHHQSFFSQGNCLRRQHRDQRKEPNRSRLLGLVLPYIFHFLVHKWLVQVHAEKNNKFNDTLKIWPCYGYCQGSKSMGHSCSWAWLDQGICQSGIPLDCGLGTLFGCLVVFQSFLCQSYFSNYSAHKPQDQMLCVVPVCGWKLWSHQGCFSPPQYHWWA